MADRRRNLGLPSGVVFPFAGTAAPYGYVICDGSAVSRTEYASLFAAIGTSHGSGNGSTTFNLPDYRGRFLRGVDGLAGLDPDKASRTAMNAGGATGNAVGTVQGGAVGQMTGAYENYVGPRDANLLRDTTKVSGGSVGTINYTTNTITIGSTETRPKNANVNYIIKI